MSTVNGNMTPELVKKAKAAIHFGDEEIRRDVPLAIPHFYVKSARGEVTESEHTDEWKLARYMAMTFFHQTVAWSWAIKEDLGFKHDEKALFNNWLKTGDKAMALLEKRVSVPDNLFEAGEDFVKLFRSLYYLNLESNTAALNILGVVSAWANNDIEGLMQFYRELGVYISQKRTLTVEMPS